MLAAENSSATISCTVTNQTILIEAYNMPDFVPVCEDITVLQEARGSLSDSKISNFLGSQ